MQALYVNLALLVHVVHYTMSKYYVIEHIVKNSIASLKIIIIIIFVDTQFLLVVFWQCF